MELLHADPLDGEPADAAEAAITARSPLQLFWRRLRRDRVAMTALFFIGMLVLIALFAPLIVKIFGTHGPNVPDRTTLDDFGLPDPSSGGSPTLDFWPPWKAQIGEHPFGVDQLGRDVFSRTIYGARVSLQVAFIATAISIVIGVTLGMVAGYFRGWVDSVLSRIMDIQLAFPVLILAIGLGAACALGNGCFGGLIKPGLPTVIFVIALASWPYFARIIRGPGPVAAREGVHRGVTLAGRRRTSGSSSGRSSRTSSLRSSSTRRS